MQVTLQENLHIPGLRIQEFAVLLCTNSNQKMGMGGSDLMLQHWVNTELEDRKRAGSSQLEATVLCFCDFLPLCAV